MSEQYVCQSDHSSRRNAERWNPMQYYDYWREEKNKPVNISKVPFRISN